MLDLLHQRVNENQPICSQRHGWAAIPALIALVALGRALVRLGVWATQVRMGDSWGSRDCTAPTSRERASRSLLGCACILLPGKTLPRLQSCELVPEDRLRGLQ